MEKGFKVSFKVGDRVRFGKAERVVEEIASNAMLPVIVRFKNFYQVERFSLDGKLFSSWTDDFPKLELIQDETVVLKNDCFKTDIGNE